jgi:hypothetical protein
MADYFLLPYYIFEEPFFLGFLWSVTNFGKPQLLWWKFREKRDGVRNRALRKTETKTETDRFSIYRNSTNGRFSKISVFGFPDSGRFCLLGCHFSEFVLHVFVGKFFCSDKCVIILILWRFTWLSRISILISFWQKGFSLGATSTILLNSTTTKLLSGLHHKPFVRS